MCNECVLYELTYSQGISEFLKTAMGVRDNTSICKDNSSIQEMNDNKDLNENKAKPENVSSCEEINMCSEKNTISVKDPSRRGSLLKTLRKNSVDIILEESEQYLQHKIEDEDKLSPTTCIVNCFGNDKTSCKDPVRKENSSKSINHKTSSDAILEETELHLQHAIERESKLPPTSFIGKFRYRGEKVLNSKQILLLVVVLNVLDCILVLGELILDVYYIKGVIDHTKGVGINFVTDMKYKYPEDLQYLEDGDIQLLFDKVLDAYIEWGTNHLHRNNLTTTREIEDDALNQRERTLLEKTNDDERQKRHANTFVLVDDDKESRAKNNNSRHEMLGGKLKQHIHTIEEKIGKAFHKSSITILCILVVVTFFKMFCIGKLYFRKFIVAFDGFIVITSLVIDLVLFQGLHIYMMQEIVIVLAFLVPWRVIRVVNSLVVAIKDQDNFRMKLMYKQQKTISQNVSDLLQREKKLELANNVLRNMLLSGGVSEVEIDQKLAMFKLKQTKGRRLSLSLLRRSSKDDTFDGIETTCTLSILANKINQNVLPISKSIEMLKSNKRLDPSTTFSKSMDSGLDVKDDDSPSDISNSDLS